MMFVVSRSNISFSEINKVFIKISILRRGAVNYQFFLQKKRFLLFRLPSLSAFWRSLTRSLLYIWTNIIKHTHKLHIQVKWLWVIFHAWNFLLHSHIVWNKTKSAVELTHTQRKRERVELKLILITNQQSWTNLQFTSALTLCAEIETLTFVYCCESCSALQWNNAWILRNGNLYAFNRMCHCTSTARTSVRARERQHFE